MFVYNNSVTQLFFLVSKITVMSHQEDKHTVTSQPQPYGDGVCNINIKIMSFT